MKFAVDKERFKLYIRLGGAYLILWLFVDLVMHSDTFPQRLANNIWLIGFLIVNNFIFLEYTLPFIQLRWKRILAAPFLLAAHALLYSIGFYAWQSIGIFIRIYTDFTKDASTETEEPYRFPYSFASIIFFGIFRHFYDYRKLKEAAQQLRIEKQEAELNYLKSQTNPHFLFNTLNNIYSLSRDKSDLAPESILRLSKILRFMLYETGGAYIAIEQELKIMNDYLALERLRYDDSLRVNFNYDIEDMRQSLPPLLLIPLVENAFKHGVSETRHQPFVDIHLSVQNRRLTFEVKNSSEGYSGEDNVKENIGLSNLRRQLALLYTDYSLSVQQNESVFSAILKINLASHV